MKKKWERPTLNVLVQSTKTENLITLGDCATSAGTNAIQNDTGCYDTTACSTACSA